MGNIDLRSRWYQPEQFITDGPMLKLIYEKVNAHSRILDAGAGADYKWRGSPAVVER